ncbi:MAG: acyl-CoA thioesterase [Anaerolineales bacterium]|nr:acyl-CoA thioesterase [Anaerolineales bacterium]MDW8161475.1 thioesterase family protein [Anaerolineales bacterium]
MSEFRFFHPIEVRYGDLDPQGHVNNAKIVTYLEQARIQYIKYLNLWRGGSFSDLGIILAEVRVSYKAPIYFGQPLRVGVRVTRLGHKSFEMAYRVEDAVSRAELVTASTVQVAYDYRQQKSIPIPEEWRSAISVFEGLEGRQVPDAPLNL